MQKAGRHGSYATQFWTRPTRPPHRSRREMLAAHSTKAVQRRLVLPLDAHDWGRALEVLGARYAKLGRTAADYQRVIRGLATETAPQRRRDAVRVLDALRDKAYEGNIASSGLWVTLVWAYAQLRSPQEGYECLLQAERRHRFSLLTRHHMGESLLPLLAECGMLAETKYVVANFMNAGGSRHEQEWVARIVAEAAARSGSWEIAAASFQEDVTAQKTAVIPRSLASLFVSKAVGGAGSAPHAQKQLPRLSTGALRSMMSSMADDGQWMMALQCLEELQQRRSEDVFASSAAVAISSEAMGRRQEPSLSESELQRLLNGLGSQQRWKEAVALFESYYYPEAPSSSLSSQGKVQSMQATTLNLLFASFPRESKKFRLVAPDADHDSQALSSAVEQQQQEEGSPLQLQLDMLHHPQQAVAVFDRLLNERDDIVITDYMVAAVGPALVQLGHWDRALHLLRHAPALSIANSSACTMEAQRDVRKRLMSLLYYLHSTISLEAQYYTLYHFPLALPKEAYRDLPPPSQLAVHLQQQKENQQQQQKRQRQKSVARPTTSFASVDASVSRRFMSRRRSSIVLNTERQDAELKRRLKELYAKRSVAFRDDADPDRDPRPPPKGLHDTANGWNFYGRGGEMAFMNHRRTAHPFSLHPKVMRSLADPYRGWSLRQNSCWAHRERVRKWNGHSAV